MEEQCGITKFSNNLLYTYFFVFFIEKNNDLFVLTQLYLELLLSYCRPKSLFTCFIYNTLMISRLTPVGYMSYFKKLLKHHYKVSKLLTFQIKELALSNVSIACLIVFYLHNKKTKRYL